jgi:2-polyprenyl-3-methyl-5-hydroxy-6-metoxy-1,4-benzoquinol methylase
MLLPTAPGYLPAPLASELNAELITGLDSWRTLVACPVCGAQALRKFATIRHFPYSRCRNCGFTFANPVPPESVLYDFYNSPYYLNYRRLEVNRIARQRYYSNSMYMDMRALARWIAVDKTSTVLDYGCGPGAFLALLRDGFGFREVEGLEINRESAFIAQQHYNLTIASSVAELRYPAYDVVILNEVIEHLPDPGVSFGEVSRLVRPSGHVLVCTPAVDNPMGRFFPRICPDYTPPSHISLFTRKALATLLTRSGFDIVRIEGSPAMALVEGLVSSLVYDLDFASPGHDDDTSDALVVPNIAGRALGLKSKRLKEAGLLRRALRRLDRWLTRLITNYPSVFPVTVNAHLFVLAQKRGGDMGAAQRRRG